MFSCEFLQNFEEHLFYRTPLDDCFYIQQRFQRNADASKTDVSKRDIQVIIYYATGSIMNCLFSCTAYQYSSEKLSLKIFFKCVQRHLLEQLKYICMLGAQNIFNINFVTDISKQDISTVTYLAAFVISSFLSFCNTYFEKA